MSTADWATLTITVAMLALSGAVCAWLANLDTRRRQADLRFIADIMRAMNEETRSIG